jgi:hypothetical protein
MLRVNPERAFTSASIGSVDARPQSLVGAALVPCNTEREQARGRRLRTGLLADHEADDARAVEDDRRSLDYAGVFRRSARLCGLKYLADQPEHDLAVWSHTAKNTHRLDRGQPEVRVIPDDPELSAIPGVRDDVGQGADLALDFLWIGGLAGIGLELQR